MQRYSDIMRHILGGKLLMKVSYNRLWKLMIDKKMKKSELQRKAQISGNIITRLNKDEFVSMETIAKICDVLECGVDDILEFSKD